jgi:hypothetical protein
MSPDLADVQVEHDRRLLKRQPKLLGRKWTRMAASPFAFLRGASGLWAEALKRQPKLLHGFPGRGVVVGDLHLENFGTFQTAKGPAFQVNDFDETFVGPWAFDLLRVLTSVLLARGELGVSGTAVLSLADALLEGHARGVRGGRQSPPSFIEELLDEASRASEEKLLKKKLESRERLARDGERLIPAPEAVVRDVPDALRRWAATLEPRVRELEGLQVLDVVRRVAGTGSLGVERALALCRGLDGLVLVELKQARGSPTDPVATSSERLVELMRKALPAMPEGFGWSRLGGLPVVVHPLHPGEEKLEAAGLPAKQLGEVMHYLGFVAGQVHRNGADEVGKWTGPQARQLIDRASDLAGLHAHAFLDFCRLVAEER